MKNRRNDRISETQRIRISNPIHIDEYIVRSECKIGFKAQKSAL